MVGDQRGDLPARHQVADVLGLALREGPVATVVLGVVAERAPGRRGWRRGRPRSRRSCGWGRCRTAISRVGRSGWVQSPCSGSSPSGLFTRQFLRWYSYGITRLASRWVRRGRSIGPLAASRETLKPSGFTTGNDDRAHVAHEAPYPWVLGLVAVHQLVSPFHRVLGGGPFARVVRAHLEEDGLAVPALDAVVISMPWTLCR